MPKLPKTIYVQWKALDDDDDAYLSAYDTLQECVDDDGPVLIGKYELVQEKKYKRIVMEA